MQFSGKFGMAFGIALAVLALVGVFSYRKVLQESSDQDWVSHTHLVLEKLDALQLDVVNAETWQRGYLITGDTNYLGLYQEALTNVDNHLDDVQNLTTDNPQRQEDVRQLRPLIAKKIAGLQERIVLRQESLEAAAEGMREAHVIELTHEVRDGIEAMKAGERELLRKRNEVANASSRRVAQLIVMGNLVGAVLLCIAGLLIRAEFHKRTAAEQTAVKRGLELSASNKELEAFCYSVSHDLRAPLRGIDGFSQALIEDYADKLDEQGKKYLERVRLGTQRMGALIDDLLNLSRLTRAELQREKVNLSTVAKTVAKDISSTQPDRNVDVQIAPNLPTFADPRLMRIVFENLLGNAWKFTSKAPRAQITVGSEPDSSSKEGSPAFFVKDNGAGFNPEYSSRLFGAFQRLHRADEFPGTGIGLATVQRIIHRHGGHIWAKSDPGKGATFYFTLDQNHHQLEARHA